MGMRTRTYPVDEVPVSVCGLDERAIAKDARVIDDNINTAKGVKRSLHHLNGKNTA